MVVFRFFISSVFSEARLTPSRFELQRSVDAEIRRPSGGPPRSGSIYSSCCRAQCGNIRITQPKFQVSDETLIADAAPAGPAGHYRSPGRRWLQPASRYLLQM